MLRGKGQGTALTPASGPSSQHREMVIELAEPCFPPSHGYLPPSLALPPRHREKGKALSSRPSPACGLERRKTEWSQPSARRPNVLGRGAAGGGEGRYKPPSRCPSPDVAGGRGQGMRAGGLPPRKRLQRLTTRNLAGTRPGAPAQKEPHQYQIDEKQSRRDEECGCLPARSTAGGDRT